MSEPAASSAPAEEQIPAAQRFFDNFVLLLVLGNLIMLVSFTGWGLVEILSLRPAPLP